MLNKTKHIKLFGLGEQPGIKPVFYFLIIVLFSFESIAQDNLVPNGSFEEYNWCPDYDNGFFITACKEWTMPTLGTSDYFNSCSTFYDVSLNRYMFSVPENYIGYQKARTGNAYVGLLYSQYLDEFGKYSASYSEYIQVKLKQKLDGGVFYNLTFYLSNVGAIGLPWAICANSIGALFSPLELHEFHDSIIQITPQFQSDLDLFFCDTTKWYQLEYNFQADGNEEFLIIGVFTPMPLTFVTDKKGDLISPYGDRYYYIDDVSLTRMDDISSLIQDKVPNVFTPNNDGVNDIFSLDQLSIKPKKMSIINRWGNIIFQTEDNFSWDGTYEGMKCIDGVYYYLIEFTKNIKINGFIHLIR